MSPRDICWTSMIGLDKIYSEDVRGEIETRRPHQCCAVIKEPMLANPGPHSGSGLPSVA